MMRHYYYSPKEKWLRVAIVLLVLLGIVIVVIAINRCSNTHKKDKPPLYPGETVKKTSETDSTDKSVDDDSKLQQSTDTVSWDSDCTKWLSTNHTADTDETECTPDERSLGDDNLSEKNNGYGDELDKEDSDYDFSSYSGYDDVSNGESEENDGIAPPNGKTEYTPPTIKPGAIRKQPGGNNNPPHFERHPDDNSGNNLSGNPPPFKGVSKSKQKGPLWFVILIVLLIIYIIATIISRGGVLVVWAGPFDKALVIISAILFFIACVIENEQGLSGLHITLLSVSSLLMLVSFFFSIVSNIGNILNIILSILSKLFIFVLVNFSILVLIVVVFVYFMIKAAKHSRN